MKRTARPFQDRAMAGAPFATWKYRHDGPLERSPLQRRIGLALLAAGPLVYLVSRILPLGIAPCVIGAIVLLNGQRRLRVGPRYLICGPHIVYFANIDRALRDSAAGTLRLERAGKTVFILERERFSSNARKPHKIAAHRAARFDKASALLLARLRAATPDCRIEG